MPLNPSILWSQRSDTVSLTFNVQDLKNIKTSVDESKLSFSAASGNNEYAIEIEFFDKVDPESFKETRTDRHYVVTLNKKTKSDEYWPRLLSTTTKQHWLRVDFSNWRESDEDVDDEFGKMYPGNDLANLGKFDGMNMNFDNFNASSPESSDDEDESADNANERQTENETPSSDQADKPSAENSETPAARLNESAPAAEVSS